MNPPEPDAGGALPKTLSYREAGDLNAVRQFVRGHALALGMSEARTELLMLAVNELATNTMQHTTGGGRVRVWADAGQVVCDVVDQGPPRTFQRPMPAPEAVRGRGLAIVERICDQVDSVSGPDGTTVRLRLHL
ncbi:ATP-binding protein [Dactylosporangium aurantiacum]|uniref:ATP-binding protein n=1 Tax=Dactylosporangium aurantiacum TaxID=35754 RepID=A0A9Q9IPP1_9ACTN|nr:ATP-binding protein [Dactylosporangium aurantiacum]MDG6103237.1 ATP-binding protein [Dactylosporangium aurantiacum]UWZ57740.1 ATP-binding protein [Dactylosporangium aurantiacum]